MLNSFYILCQICVFSAKPQDLPSSKEFFIQTVFFALVVSLLGMNLLPTTKNPWIATIVYILLSGIVWYVILQLAKKTDRWYQSASALYGCHALLSVLSIPIVMASADQLLAKPLVLTPGLGAIAALGIWKIIITTIIVRETLEIKTGMSFAISIGMMLVVEIVVMSIFIPA